MEGGGPYIQIRATLWFDSMSIKRLDSCCHCVLLLALNMAKSPSSLEQREDLIMNYERTEEELASRRNDKMART